MSRESLTVLFADVTDNASLFEQAGDEFARETIPDMLTLHADRVPRQQGISGNTLCHRERVA